jgi:hypothetical protein
MRCRRFDRYCSMRLRAVSLTIRCRKTDRICLSITAAQDFDGTLAGIIADPAIRMINRNRSSGTRVLLDQILGDHQPPGFLSEA